MFQIGVERVTGEQVRLTPYLFEEHKVCAQCGRRLYVCDVCVVAGVDLVCSVDCLAEWQKEQKEEKP